MKAHEETWELVPRNGGWRLHAEGEEEFATGWGAGEHEEARAKLAAAAPEMARVLIELADHEGTGCVCCGFASCNTLAPCEHGGEPHHTDCKLYRALLKAGIAS